MGRLFALLLAIINSMMSLFGLPYGEQDIILTKNAVLNVETRSDIFCPPSEVWENGAQYPTIISLSHNGENNGTLLCSFEVFDKGETNFKIMKSTDHGENWELISTVKETADASLSAAWEPCLFELSQALGDFSEGTILLGGISIDDGCKSKTRLSVYASDDCGKTWSEISAVDEAGGTGDGIWEPFFVFDGGYLYCFYSDDSDAVHSQTIVYKRTADGINWSEKTSVVVSDNTQDRPGMPVVTKMGNDKYFLCYEFGNGDGYPIYYKVSDSIESWNASDIGKEISTKSQRSIGSSPCCVWIPKGGKNGMLIVSGKYGNKGHNELLVSFDYGESFRTMINPLPYSDQKGCGYSPSMFYSQEEDMLFYANTVEYKDGLSKIAFARISVSEIGLFC